VQELDRHDIVLFAGHALATPDAPEESRLLLAPGVGDDTGELTARDVAALRLTRPELVILSACRTAGGRPAVLEGMTGLAQSFLVAGVPAVVATLWEVPDNAAHAFLAAFVERFAVDGDPVRALTAARVATLRGGVYGPEVWSAFELVGAPAPIPVRSLPKEEAR